jgi:2-haloacid dehalogenase
MFRGGTARKNRFSPDVFFSTMTGVSMKQIKGVVFDLYGTLYDVHSVAGLCDRYFPGRGREISLLWRQKQLEYTWLRSLMGQYIPFEQATSDALLFVDENMKLGLRADQREALCDEYLRIKLYPEVRSTLQTLRARGLQLAILSNGSVSSIHSVVENSGLMPLFDHLISVEGVKVFKPHAHAYELGEKTLKLHRSELLFVSSNAWDASGAHHFGYSVCWVNRVGNTFDHLGQVPDYIVQSLDALPELAALTRVAT